MSTWDTRTATSIFAPPTPGLQSVQTSHSSVFALSPEQYRAVLHCRSPAAAGGQSNYLVCPRLRLARLGLSRSWSLPPASHTSHWRPWLLIVIFPQLWHQKKISFTRNFPHCAQRPYAGNSDQASAANMAWFLSNCLPPKKNRKFNLPAELPVAVAALSRQLRQHATLVSLPYVMS